ncbi:hypothetical protein PMAYCL1PPCAC_20031, partial [Pristionchus mayeri]
MGNRENSLDILHFDSFFQPCHRVPPPFFLDSGSIIFILLLLLLYPRFSILLSSFSLSCLCLALLPQENLVVALLRFLLLLLFSPS